MALSSQPKLTPPNAVRIADADVPLGSNVRITPQARYYALAELSRRAGIPGEFFRSWRVSFTPEKTILEIANGISKFITFPHASAGHLKSLAARNFTYSTFASTERTSGKDRGRELDCMVPFVDAKNTGRRPLFILADPNHLECNVDLALSILLTLSRWEELLDTPCDLHGRFQAKNSIAFAGGFVDRPIVDEYGLAFEEAMQLLFPSWKKTQRTLRIKLSHDADHVGIPFRLRTALRHCIRYRSVPDALKDISSCIWNVQPAELRSIRDIALCFRESRFEVHRLLEGRPTGTKGQRV